MWRILERKFDPSYLKWEWPWNTWFKSAIYINIKADEVCKIINNSFVKHVCAYWFIVHVSTHVIFWLCSIWPFDVIESTANQLKQCSHNSVASKHRDVKVKVTLRPTVSRPVRLGVRHPSRARDKFFFLLEIFFRQLRVCYFVAPSQRKGRVCNLLLLLVLASAVPLGSALSDERSSINL
jgi:hypothetical protein